MFMRILIGKVCVHIRDLYHSECFGLFGFLDCLAVEGRLDIDVLSMRIDLSVRILYNLDMH
jgi:hypothetical protein